MCPRLSHQCTPSGHFLLRLWGIQSSAPPADQGSSQPAAQTSCGVIACQSCLRACFSSRRHAPDKKHIFTHKNEITGNLESRSFGGNACYRAVQVDELLSPLALYQLETKGGDGGENRDRGELKKKKEGTLREFWLGLLTSCHPCHFLCISSTAHIFLFP